MSQSFLHLAAMHEEGSAAALDIADSHHRIFSTTLGIRSFYDLSVATSLRLYSDIGWRHDFGGQAAKSQHHFHGAGRSFDVKGAFMPRDSGFVGLGLQANFSENVALDVGYQGQFGHGSTEHSVNLQLKIKF